MGKVLKREKAERRDFPEMHKTKVGKTFKTDELHRSIPEMLMMGLAIGLKIVGVITFLVAGIAVVVGGLGIWGRVRGARK